MNSFVKWVGGKSRFIKDNLNLFPGKFNSYYEPFVGAGSVFLALQPKRATISDINYELIITWRVIQCNVEGLIKSLRAMEKKYSKDYFYAVRSQDIQEISPLQIASRFIFLNKTCFNGLYRVNKKGQFNVSFGKTSSGKDPVICNEENLRRISKYLNTARVRIECLPYDWIHKKVYKGDLVYMDPPYIDDAGMFVSYTPDGFTYNNHVELMEFGKKLVKRNAFVAISNSYNDLSKSIIPDGWKTWEVEINRSVSCKNSSRGKNTEMLITSYGILA